MGGAGGVDGGGGSAPRDRTQPRPVARRVLHADPNCAAATGGDPDALSRRQPAHVLLGAGSDFSRAVGRASVDASAAGGGIRRGCRARSVFSGSRSDYTPGIAVGDNPADRFLPSRVVFAKCTWLHWDALLDAAMHDLSATRIAQHEAVDLVDLRRRGSAGHLYAPDHGVCGDKPCGNLRLAAAVSRKKEETTGLRTGIYRRWG